MPKFGRTPPRRKGRQSKEIDALFEAFDECIWPYKSYTPGLFVDSLPRRYIVTAKDLRFYTENYSPIDDYRQRWLVFNEDSKRVEMFEYRKTPGQYQEYLDW